MKMNNCIPEIKATTIVYRKSSGCFIRYSTALISMPLNRNYENTPDIFMPKHMNRTRVLIHNLMFQDPAEKCVKQAAGPD